MQRNEFLLRCQVAASQRFGISVLRESQIQVLSALYSSDNTQMQAILATMPTGAGKTLIYALASIVLKKPVLVISPLIALMREQVQRMKAAQINAFMASGDQTKEERHDLKTAIVLKKVDMIFASPEKCFTSYFQHLLSLFDPYLVVCDEAHCVASWGHGFRPEYSKISEFIKKIKPCTVLALSATIPGPVKSIVQSRLVELPKTVSWKEILFDPLPQHLYLESLRTYSENERKKILLDILESASSQKVIIYVSRRSLCDSMVSTLCELGYKAVPYHAGMDKDQRKAIERHLKQSENCVVCATLAYGMGVDLAGVQHVICYGLPNGITDFIQMVGRAGRNGDIARGTLIWTGSDVKKREYQFKLTFPTIPLLQKAYGALETHLPCPPCERWFSWDHICQLLGGAGIKESAFVGIMNAFRFLNMVKTSFPLSHYLMISFPNSVSLQDELGQLPPHPTQRGYLLGAIQECCGKEWSETKGAASLVALVDVEYALGAPIGSFNKVIDYFKTNRSVQIHVKSGLELEQGFVVLKTPGLTRHVVREYEKIFRAEQESLEQLIDLAQTRECRLSRCRTYFNGTFSDRVDLPQYMVYCNQCDICMERQKNHGNVVPKGDVYNNFHMFQKLWLSFEQNQGWVIRTN